MNNESEQKAKEYFVHYFRMLAKEARLHWDIDNDGEIEAAVEYLIRAAVERARQPSIPNPKQF